MINKNDKKKITKIAVQKFNLELNDKLLRLIYALQKNLGLKDARKVINLIGMDRLNYISRYW